MTDNELPEQGFQSNQPERDVPNPSGWLDGAPTSGAGHRCALCANGEVAWVHPLAPELVTYREYGKGHTLPTFWTTCNRCEDLYAAGNEHAIVQIMRTSSLWSWAADADVEDCVLQPLRVFRRADLGARPLTS